ncbi:hypothetical protein HRbin15_00493 [bacterium HR15]|nr:hypothetical protein HRbin15_00493 [bacterium HR15]
MRSATVAVWILRLLGAGFLAFGLLFAFAPSATVGYFSQWGVALGWTQLPSEGEDGFWRVLAVAFMVMVTVLAFWGAQPTPARPALLMVLAVGKLSSSLLALLFYWQVAPYFIYLLNFIVDGIIALVVFGCRQVLVQEASSGGRAR